jgi:hypothetical protein
MNIDRSIDERIVLQPEDKPEQELLGLIFEFGEAYGFFPFFTLDLPEYPALDEDLHREAPLNPRGDVIDPAPGARALVVGFDREDYQ